MRPDARVAHLGRLALFGGVAVALHVLQSLPAVHAQIVEPYTRWVTAAAAFLMRLAHPTIAHAGNVLSDGTTSVAVLDVCNGSDVLVLFAAAVVASPARPRHRAAGLIVGVAILAAVNLSRVVGLFAIARWAPDALAFAHAVAAQVVMVCVCAALFIAYRRWVDRRALV